MDILIQIQLGILALVLPILFYTLRDNYGVFSNMPQMWYIDISF